MQKVGLFEQALKVTPTEYHSKVGQRAALAPRPGVADSERRIVAFRPINCQIRYRPDSGE